MPFSIFHFPLKTTLRGFKIRNYFYPLPNKFIIFLKFFLYNFKNIIKSMKILFINFCRFLQSISVIIFDKMFRNKCNVPGRVTHLVINVTSLIRLLDLEILIPLMIIQDTI